MLSWLRGLFAGRPGAPGASVVAAEIDENGDLVLTLSDGNVVNAGNPQPRRPSVTSVVAELACCFAEGRQAYATEVMAKFVGYLVKSADPGQSLMFYLDNAGGYDTWKEFRELLAEICVTDEGRLVVTAFIEAVLRGGKPGAWEEAMSEIRRPDGLGWVNLGKWIGRTGVEVAPPVAQISGGDLLEALRTVLE